MTKLLFLLLIFFTACEPKQWNLNKSIGWDPDKMEDFTVVFVKWNCLQVDSTDLKAKREFDFEIIEKLRSNKLGDQAENDDKSESDLLFIVPKNYKKALRVILSVSKSYNVLHQTIIYERKYISYDKWEDKVIHEEGK